MDRMLPLICLSSSKQQAGVENGPQTQAAANPTGNFADSDDTCISTTIIACHAPQERSPAVTNWLPSCDCGNSTGLDGTILPHACMRAYDLLPPTIREQSFL
ncbi:hypothetical protein DAI22_07g145700 [Oryza sativa Japonica Group]|nr:hypothetical protein DAI22_07g145700 [Oryza sativa Japonica Group]